MENRPTVYIAGPITNGGLTPRSDAFERFRVACLEVIQLGYVPVSPLEINAEIAHGEDRWRAVMRLDIPALINCDGAYFLAGWENSRGARLEHLIAEGLGLFILYQEESGASKS